MTRLLVRKTISQVEEIRHEGGPPSDRSLRKAAILTVVNNPFAGRYVDDIAKLMNELEPLGVAMARRLVDLLGGDPGTVEAYGKGAIIGEGGEIEHGALWHAPGGYAMREVLGGTRAIVPSTKKVGVPGATLDVPLAHINAAYVRSHFDTIVVGVNDAPRQDEMCLILAMSTGPRIHNRSLGLDASEIRGEDGLR